MAFSSCSLVGSGTKRSACPTLGTTVFASCRKPAISNGTSPAVRSGSSGSTNEKPSLGRRASVSANRVSPDGASLGQMEKYSRYLASPIATVGEPSFESLHNPVCEDLTRRVLERRKRYKALTAHIFYGSPSVRGFEFRPLKITKLDSVGTALNLADLPPSTIFDSIRCLPRKNELGWLCWILEPNFHGTFLNAACKAVRLAFSCAITKSARASEKGSGNGNVVHHCAIASIR